MSSHSNRLRSIRGFADILPGDSPTWCFVEAALQRTLAEYGFEEIRLPIVESTELFARSIGEATDIVEKEMYTFADRNDDSVTLRPEGTAGCVRAAIEHNLLHERESRLWYSGPMFRYERPQRGRYRQFHQVGAELFGPTGPDVDAELIALTGRMLKRLGLRDIRLEINSLGDAPTRAAYREELAEYFRGHATALDADSQRRLDTNPLRILDSKNPDMQPVIAGAPRLIDRLDASSRG